MKKFIVVLFLIFLFISPVFAEEPIMTLKASYSFTKAFNDRIEIYRDKGLMALGTPGLKTIYYKDILSVSFDKDYIITFRTAEPIVCNSVSCNQYDNQIYANTKQMREMDKENNEFVSFVNFLTKKVTESKQAKSNYSFSDEIEKLGKLKEKGLITQQEFDNKKKQLLGL